LDRLLEASSVDYSRRDALAPGRPTERAESPTRKLSREGFLLNSLRNQFPLVDPEENRRKAEKRGFQFPAVKWELSKEYGIFVELDGFSDSEKAA